MESTPALLRKFPSFGVAKMPECELGTCGESLPDEMIVTQRKKRLERNSFDHIVRIHGASPLSCVTS